MFGEQQRFMLFLIAPAALLLLLFQVLPIVIGANASFRDWALYNPKKTWVGFDHYRAVITAIMMRWMFNDQFGIVNVVLEGLGLEGQPWLVQRWSAFGIILLTDIWLWTPWFTLLLLAGLQSLPKEPFEAAAIDGTTTWRVFRFLTLPMLRPVIVVCVVIRAIDAFRTFDIVWTLTGGGPGRSTELFSLYAYVLAFLSLDLGRGSAAAIIGGLIILVIGVVLYRLVDRIAKA